MNTQNENAPKFIDQAYDLMKSLISEYDIPREWNHSPGSFTWKYGRLWRVSEEPIYYYSSKPYTSRNAYKNALRCALENPHFTYVEGFAGVTKLVGHAWCVTKKKEVVDPTWRNFGTVYFGVPFRGTYISRDWVGTPPFITGWENPEFLLNRTPMYLRSAVISPLQYR